MSASRRTVDRGSASVWVLAACAVVLFLAAITTVRELAVLARHRVESSADLAALAAAGRIGLGSDGCATAARLAARDGVVLRSCRSTLAADGRSGRVAVRVALVIRLPIVGTRTVTASARAGRLPGG